MFASLPISASLEAINHALKHHNKAILQAPPGAGKTTAVPLALRDALWLKGQKIIMLEPRRLAARHAAQRMASLLNEPVGNTVGYQIRNDRQITPKTRIIVLTEGILTRMLQQDPMLEDVGLLLFDEFHERSLHADLALALALHTQELFRDDLRIMPMSATLGTETLSALLENAPLICSEGRSFNVTHHYLDAKTPQPHPKALPHLLRNTILQALTKHEGNILVFLPGVKEITACETLLRESVKDPAIQITPLYGTLDMKTQQRAIAPTKNSERKVVLATNIAETSLTIEGISVVIDSGLERISYYDPASKMNRLHTRIISQDSATQRSGRAGRLCEGVCYRLWHEHKVLGRHQMPEILRSDISTMMLELFAWGVTSPAELRFLDLPHDDAIAEAMRLLEHLGALKSGNITAYGKALQRFSCHPRLAHMMLQSQRFGWCEEAALLAAMLDERDIGAKHLGVNIAARMAYLATGHNDDVTLKRIRRNASLYLQRLQAQPEQQRPQDHIAVLLGFAYPERIAKERTPGSGRYLLAEGKGAQLHHDDALYRSPYLVIADLQEQREDAQIFRAAALSEVSLLHYFADTITQEEHVRWNSAAQRIEARTLSKLGSIILKERILHDLTPQQIQEALLQTLRCEGLQLLGFSKTLETFRQRVAFIRHHDTASTLPELSDTALMQRLQEWLLPYLGDISTMNELRGLDHLGMIRTLLEWEQLQTLETLAPQTYEVPSGSHIRINYEAPHAPKLSVQLQELFGLLETPRILGGSVALSIELLSPAKRPIQLTQDLYSFWSNTYEEVRKELRGKYKKHYWPEDPFSAQATKKTKKYM